MIEGLFLAFLYVFGLCANLLLRGRLPFLALVLTAFPVGLALWVAITIGFVCLSLPYKAAPIFTACGTLSLAMLILNLRLPKLSKSQWLVLTVYFSVFLGVIAAARRYNLTVLSYDSFILIDIARIIGRDSFVSPYTGSMLASWGFFVIGAQTAATLLGFEYLYALQPVFAACFAGVFIYFTYRCLRVLKLPIGIAGAVSLATALALFSTYFIVFQFFYIHNSMPSAAYLFMGLSALWLGLATENRNWFYFSALSLASFALLRTEGPLMVSLFLFLAFAGSDIPQSTARKFLLPFSIFILVWYIKLIFVIGEGSDIMTPARAVAAVGPLLVFSLVRSFVPWRLMGLLEINAGRILLIGLVLVAFALTLNKLDHMITSLKYMLLNMHYAGRWGWVWHVMVGLFLLSFFRPRFPRADLMVFGISSFFLVIYILVFLRTPYRLGWGDSANRIFTHILPVVFLYNVMRLAAPRSDPDTPHVA